MESILIFVVMIVGFVGICYLGWLITKDKDDTWNVPEDTNFIDMSCVICKGKLTLWEKGDNEEIWKCKECNTEQIFKKIPKAGTYIK